MAPVFTPSLSPSGPSLFFSLPSSLSLSLSGNHWLSAVVTTITFYILLSHPSPLIFYILIRTSHFFLTSCLWQSVTFSVLTTEAPPSPDPHKWKSMQAARHTSPWSFHIQWKKQTLWKSRQHDHCWTAVTHQRRAEQTISSPEANLFTVDNFYTNNKIHSATENLFFYLIYSIIAMPLII